MYVCMYVHIYIYTHVYAFGQVGDLLRVRAEAAAEEPAGLLLQAI